MVVVEQLKIGSDFGTNDDENSSRRHFNGLKSPAHVVHVAAHSTMFHIAITGPRASSCAAVPTPARVRRTCLRSDIMDVSW